MGGVRRSRQGSILLVQLDNPPVNALSAEVLEALEETMRDAAQDSAVRALVIYGGDSIFAAGADLPSFLRQGFSPEAALRRGVEVFDALATLPKPVVAAIQGHCLGGGLELACAADLRVASPRSRFGQPEVHLGILPGWNGTVRLPRLIGSARAAELILTGEPIDGRRAYEIGLVTRLVPDDEVLPAALNLARLLAAQSGAAVAEARRLLAQWTEPGAAERERQAVLRLMAGPDAAEGLTAFMERRRPRFGDS
jgi:enoyl-CoA hydratase